MVDKPLLLRKLTELDEYLKQMGEFSSVTREEYSRDWKVQRIVERTLRNNLNNFTVYRDAILKILD
ncbi:MAG: hypothetical protein NUV74_04250 [Candidatus Brocadiaceae bacterium]|nr:hypothetical protein [Candidatus Brocadiaceae bacterium]